MTTTATVTTDIPRRDFHAQMLATAGPVLHLLRDYNPPAKQRQAASEGPLIVWEVECDGLGVMFRSLREEEARSWLRIRFELHPEQGVPEMRPVEFAKA